MKEYVRLEISEYHFGWMPAILIADPIGYLQKIALNGMKPSSEPIVEVLNPAAANGKGSHIFYFPIETG